MGWGGIQNIPPGFDVFGGKQGTRNIVDDAIKGAVQGLSPAREPMFVDLKRNLLRRDYAKYFESCLPCAAVLGDIKDGIYNAEILRDLVEPALKVALEQMESIQKDAERSRAANRKMEYDAQSSLDQMHRKSLPIALAYPQAAGAKELDARYQEISATVRTLNLR
jgi:hypothetical protein